MTVSISFSVPTPDKVAQESISNLDYHEVEDTMLEGSIEIAANGHRISIEDVPLLHFAHWGLWEPLREVREGRISRYASLANDVALDIAPRGEQVVVTVEVRGRSESFTAGLRDLESAASSFVRRLYQRVAATSPQLREKRVFAHRRSEQRERFDRACRS